MIECLRRLFGGRNEKEETVKTADPIAAEESASADENDGALVAAIMAAISAMRAEEGYTGGFRVVSFKRAAAAYNRRRF